MESFATASATSTSTPSCTSAERDQFQPIQLASWPRHKWLTGACILRRRVVKYLYTTNCSSTQLTIGRILYLQLEQVQTGAQLQRLGVVS